MKNLFSVAGKVAVVTSGSSGIGELADIAGTVIYLCSRASNYVCGHTVVLDGGQVANAG
jgi:hypothetical protein